MGDRRQRRADRSLQIGELKCLAGALPGGDVAAKKGRLTNSMAVRRMDSAREKMMLQNFQSFGTP